MNKRFLRLAPVLVLTGSMPLVLAQNPEAGGTKWRITTSITGMGMNLPARTTEFCATGADQGRPLPPSQSKDCTFTTVSHSGNAVRYALQCTGHEAMQGEGEITYGPDHYSGKFQLKMSRGEMTMTYEGAKLGACSGTELGSPARTQAMRQQIQSQQTAVEQGIAQACMQQASSAATPYEFIDAFHSGRVQCSDPAELRAYCAAFVNYGPYKIQHQDEQDLTASARTRGLAESTPFTDSLRLCGLQADTLHAQLCSRALKGSADDKDGSAAFLIDECADQARTLAARECAARAYTHVMTQYLDFCGAYANSEAAKRDAATRQANGTANANPAAPGNGGASPNAVSEKASLQQKAKSVLKGLFGH